ncbi:MAG: cache domain-containing protein [Thermodesulfobacteriota bacterium]
MAPNIRDNLKIIAPALLAIVLFIVTIFGFALPVSRSNLLAQKKETLTVLSQTVSTILAHYDEQVRAGTITLATGQAMAKKQISRIRYGRDNKDYFWINDLQPKMIMHPYRPDLEEKDVSSFIDPAGRHVFLDMLEVIRAQGAGFVPYQWQKRDQTETITAKLSYVSLFQPWGWVVGTGIYLDDIQTEIARMSRHLLSISLVILTIISLLSLFIIRHGLAEARRRKAAEHQIVNYQQNLEHLVQQRTAQLREARTTIKTLKGFLPICASCKNIRNDQGYWQQIESYIKEHSDADFSHGLCPTCAKKLYPDLGLSGEK